MNDRKRLLAALAVPALAVAGAVSVVVWASGGSTRAPGAGPGAASRLNVATEAPATAVKDCVTPYPNDCDDYPVEEGGSCSCTSQLTVQQCTVCGSGQHGSLLLTTCHVCPGGGGGIPEPCHDFGSYSCSAGRS